MKTIQRKKKPLSIVDTYLEIIDVRTGYARHTGMGAIFETVEMTLASFESARSLETEDGGFLLDLYLDGDLSDTIQLNDQGVRQVTGLTPMQPSFYVALDDIYWAKARDFMMAGGGRSFGIQNL